MYHARHVKPHHWAAAAIAVVSVVALLAGVAVMRGGLGASEGRDAAGPDSAATSGGPTKESPSRTGDNAIRYALTECRSAWSSQDRVLRAAGSSLDQWGVHIRAMNELVAGEITAQQASNLWSASRVGAAQRVARYQAVDRQSLGVFRRCSRPAGTDAGAGQLRRLDACRSGAFARDDVLTSARTSIGTWRHHIHDMEQLRAGRISVTTALQRWQTNWRKGAAELRRYRHQRDAAAGMTIC
jgi:hypothetical protein